MKMTLSSVEPLNNQGRRQLQAEAWLWVFPVLGADLFLELQQGSVELYSPVW